MKILSNLLTHYYYYFVFTFIRRRRIILLVRHTIEIFVVYTICRYHVNTHVTGKKHDENIHEYDHDIFVTFFEVVSYLFTYTREMQLKVFLEPIFRTKKI